MFHLSGSECGAAVDCHADPTVQNDLMARYTGGVFVHWNFWCNVSILCRIRSAGRAGSIPLIVREYRERTYRYAIYHLRRPVAQ